MAFRKLFINVACRFELNSNGINHQKEGEMPIFYKGNDVGLRRADFLVEGEIMVELNYYRLKADRFVID